MIGTLQMVVNLRSRSVEYIRENDELERYSNVLSGDMITASDIIADVPYAYDGETDEEKCRRVVSQAVQLAERVGSLDQFSIIRRGMTVGINPDDVSFVTVNLTGDLEDLV